MNQGNKMKELLFKWYKWKSVQILEACHITSASSTFHHHFYFINMIIITMYPLHRLGILHFNQCIVLTGSVFTTLIRLDMLRSPSVVWNVECNCLHVNFPFCHHHQQEHPSLFHVVIVHKQSFYRSSHDIHN